MKAIFFDLDDTLYDQVQPFQEAYNRTFSSITDIPILDLFKKSREYSDKVFSLTESGEMSLEKMHQYRMMSAFNDLGYTITSDEADAFQQAYKEHQYKVSLIPEMKNILEYVSSKGIPVYITTNGPSAHQRSKLESLNLVQWIPANQVYISSEMGYAKPQKEYFEYVNQKTNTSHEHSLIVGDSFENDIIGAHHAGWSSIWINTKNKTKAIETIQPTYETNSYQQLEKLIKELY
ncbi:HAD family hydrolase [Neobacillus cucumis]|uniref:HAD family hydrolase n=1 Tax=Neobacillus cucumis TaxID=1740721 RepID=UPI0019631DC3|nr:HAD family hydrolase [Neobacillus cucumis]MBM7654453.1 putative hydrolase of the HAD superfamily [Neobacillus cucumis]